MRALLRLHIRRLLQSSRRRRRQRVAVIGRAFRGWAEHKVLECRPATLIQIGNHVTQNDGELRCYSGSIMIGDSLWIILAGLIVSAVRVETEDSPLLAAMPPSPTPTNTRRTQSFRVDQTDAEQRHGRRPHRSNAALAPVRIGSNVWVREWVVVLKGVTAGDGSIVAAGSVVTAEVVKRLKHIGRVLPGVEGPK